MNDSDSTARERHAKARRLLEDQRYLVASRCRDAARDGVVGPTVLMVDLEDALLTTIAEAGSSPAMVSSAVAKSRRLGDPALGIYTLSRDAAVRILALQLPDVASRVVSLPPQSWGGVVMAYGIAVIGLVYPMAPSDRHDPVAPTTGPGKKRGRDKRSQPTARTGRNRRRRSG